MFPPRLLHSLTGRRHSQRAIAGLLVLALLLAQWSGFQHRIAHGGQGGAGFITAIASSADGEDGKSGGASLHHSCLDFDATTLAFALHAAVPVTPVLPERLRPASQPDFASWHAPFPHHFLTRAPPVA